jgi:hypothetical protein
MDETIEGMQVYTIECPHCGQEALLTPLNWKTIEYGFILLTGPEDGYIGITCPNPECLHTTLKKENLEKVRRLRETLFEPAEHGPGYSKPLLRYRSFPYGFVYPRELVKYRRGFQNNEITENYQSMGEEEVYYRLAKRNRPDFRGLYVPYHFGDLAMAPAIYVPLFLKDGIEEILKHENEKRTRVFPRYMPHDEAIENIDRFCYAHFMKDLAIEKARRKLPDLNVRYTDGSSAANSAANRNHEFFQVLTGPTGQTRKRYELLRSESEDLEDEAASVDSMEREVSVKYKKGLGKDFLEKNWLAFVQEYLSTADKAGFTAHTAETLRKKYLALLNKEMEIEIFATKQYAFYEEPPTWTIIFDGKPIRSLRGEGFRYIHYLVKHMRDEISVQDLEGLEGSPVEVIPSCGKTIPRKPRDDEGHEKGSSVEEPAWSAQELGDKRYLKEIKIRIAELNEEIAEAEQQDDIGRKEKSNIELDAIMEELKNLTIPGGGLKEFKAENAKLIDKIGRSIDRAIKQLTKSNEKAGTHFRESLKPIYSPSPCYNPKVDIKWHLG